jgi:hypothetical protein
LQDFSLIKRFVERAQTENSLSAEVHAFYFVLLGTVFDLQDDEIEESIWSCR